MDGGEVMYHLRLLRCPARRRVRSADGQWACGEHTDYGTVTLPADDGVAGLEVMRRDGTWMQVAVPEDLSVVNLGDLMAIWTNGRWVSNPHRVVNPADTDRYSIPLFVTPSIRARIECLPSCLAARSTPRYAPQVAGEYLASRLDATHPYRNPLSAAHRPAARWRRARPFERRVRSRQRRVHGDGDRR